MGRDQKATAPKRIMTIPFPHDSESQWVMRAVLTQRIDPHFKYPFPDGISIDKAKSLRNRADAILEEFQGRHLVDDLADSFKNQSTRDSSQPK